MRVAGLLLAIVVVATSCWSAQAHAGARAGVPGDRPDDSLLAAPGDFSLAQIPPPSGPLAGSLPGAAPPPVAGGAVSQSFGSGGYHSTAVELDSGLLGGSTRAFLQAAAGQGPRFHDLPAVNGRSVAVGVQTALPFGTTLSLSMGTSEERLSRGGSVVLP